MKEIFAFLIRNEELASLYPLAIIIVMAYNYRPMYFGSNLKLMYLDKTSRLWRVTFVAGVINVLLNVVGIPLFGFQFAAYSTFISLMYMGYAGYFVRGFGQMTTENYYPLLWLTATVIFTVTVYLLTDIDSITKVLLSSIICFLFLIGYLKFKRLFIQDASQKS